MIASGWKLSPKWNGIGTENQDAVCRLVKSTTPPMRSAAAYPTMMPTSMPEVLSSPLAEEVAAQRDKQGQNSQEPELRRAEGAGCLGRRTAADVVDRGAIERKTDAHDNSTADNRREETTNAADKHTDKDRDKGCDKLGAEDARNAVLRTDDGQNRHIGKGDAQRSARLCRSRRPGTAAAGWSGRR